MFIQTRNLRISTSNNIRRYAQETTILGLRPEVSVTVTPKTILDTLHPKMHPHTEFGIPTCTFKTIEDMLRTRCEDSDT